MTAYTSAVGTKFHEDGRLRYFPGNTMISHTREIEPLQSQLIWIQEQYKQLSFAEEKLAFLPPSSFHMTFFELLCDQVRKPEYWSSKLPLDAPLEETDRFFAEALKGFEFPQEIHMSIADLYVTTIRLRPISEEHEAFLRAKRDELAEVTGVRQPNHDQYGFHISLAYNLRHLTDAEKEEFEAFKQRLLPQVQEKVGTFTLGAPEYVLFADMGEFRADMVRPPKRD